MSKFIKGQSGNPKGRPNGSKNKKIQHIQEYISSVLEKMDFCAFHKLIELAKYSNDQTIQLTAAKEIAQYLAPKLRSVTLTGDTENPVSFHLNLSPSTDA
ncbi:MAG: hypothetical protein A3F10_05835 [Coxiella sp. RIFCSPHIGHO2_12_FULL_42_15]|nr:MAG: hypothetical protein A3F10_05835 [Coxiella sp. RIFCSPHIGHO2_12_FULL_42_15]